MIACPHHEAEKSEVKLSKLGTVYDHLYQSGLLCGGIKCETRLKMEAADSPGPTVVFHVFFWGLPCLRS